MSKKKGNKDSGLDILADLGLTNNDSDSDDKGKKRGKKSMKGKHEEGKKNELDERKISNKNPTESIKNSIKDRGGKNRQYNDDDEEEDRPAAVPVPTKSGKGGNKKGGKNRQADDDDDDEEEDRPAPAPVPTKSGKGGNKKGGKNRQADDDDDLLLAPVVSGVDKLSLSSPLIEADTDPSPVPIKAGKSGGKKGKKNRDYDDGDLFLTPVAEPPPPIEESPPESIPTPLADVTIASQPVAASIASLPQAQSNDEEKDDADLSPTPAAASVPVKEKVHGKGLSKAERKKLKSSQKSQKKGGEGKDEGDDEELGEPSLPPPSAPMDVEEDTTLLPPAPPIAVAAAAAPVITPSVAVNQGETLNKKEDKSKKKSKLELKLEAAKKEKEEADKVAAAQAEQERLDEQSRLQQQRKLDELEENERIRSAALSEATREPPQSQNLKKKGAKAPANQVNEDVDSDALMKATMYGDDVAQEYTKQPLKSDVSHVDEESGKKLTRKEKKNQQRRAEDDQAASSAAGLNYDEAMMKSSAEGAQFAVSQSVVDESDISWQNALDIFIPSVSISAHNKELFVNAELTISHGRRYGLVGPNGAGAIPPLSCSLLFSPFPAITQPSCLVR
jgi:hypothetical protein